MEDLEDRVKDKEDELASLKVKLSSASASQNSVDSLMTGLQESLNSKEKQIERFVRNQKATLLVTWCVVVYFVQCFQLFSQLHLCWLL